MISILLVVYCFWPLVIHFAFHADPYLLQLALIAGVGSCCIAVGSALPFLDRQLASDTYRIAIPEAYFHAVLWIAFIAFLAVTFITAETIPFVSALRGATENELSAERGAFLTTRTGWQAGLIYIGTALTSALLPYSLVRLVIRRSPWSVATGLTLFAFMMSFLVKSMFLLIAMPLAHVSASRRKWSALAAVIVGSVLLLVLNTSIQKGGLDVKKLATLFETKVTPDHPVAQADVSTAAPPSPGPVPSPPPTSERSTNLEPLPTAPAPPRESAAKAPARVTPPPAPKPVSGPFFTSRYIPDSSINHLLWRTIAIPTITAADALRVFDQQYGHAYLLGATSSLIAGVFGLTRVNFDSEVFAHQWGRSAYGRSNSAFITEAYINFGWIGVIVFSLIVGLTLRWFVVSTDEAFRSLWPIYIYLIAQGSLFGTMFSNAFIVIFAIGLFVSVTPMSADGKIAKQKMKCDGSSP